MTIHRAIKSLIPVLADHGVKITGKWVLQHSDENAKKVPAEWCGQPVMVYCCKGWGSSSTSNTTAGVFIGDPEVDTAIFEYEVVRGAWVLVGGHVANFLAGS